MKAPESEEQPVVFIVDDDESLRDSLVRLFRMVGLRAEGFATAADFLKRKRPDVPSFLVFDRLPRTSGLYFRAEPTRAGSNGLRHGRSHE